MSIGLPLIVGVILLAFTWPGVTAEARDLPVGIVANAAQTQQVSQSVEANSKGAIKLRSYADREAAIRAIQQRESYGAIVLGASPSDAPEMLTATAASPQVAQILKGVAWQLQTGIDAEIHTSVESGVAAAQQQAATQLQQALAAVMRGEQPALPTPGSEALNIPTVTVQVTDIAPFTADDPNGAGLATAMFPLVIGGVIGGALIALAVKGPGARRAVATVSYAVVAGLLLTGILQGWYGALQGNYWLNALAIALTIAAIAATVTGLAGVLGRVGIPLGAGFMVLFANPIAAATVPVEFLAAPWGEIGQWLPPGAASSTLRTLSYFPDADASSSWTLLALWAAVGIALTAVMGTRTKRSSTVDTRAEGARTEGSSTEGSSTEHTREERTREVRTRTAEAVLPSGGEALSAG